MPQTYRCDICQEVAGDFMVVSIATGQTISVGVECLLEWAMPLVEAFTRAQEEYQAGSEAAQTPAGAEMAQWEAGYPQGRSEGPEEAPGDTSDLERSDTQEEATAHDQG
jgi:hypothetical protein